MDLLAKLLARIEVRGERECWPWQRACSGGGYGQMWHEGRLEYAHRLMWIATHGPLAPRVQVRHDCDNPPCCNPRHLLIGSHADNMRDMAERGRALGRGQGFAPGRHWTQTNPERIRRGSEHPGARFTDAQVGAIREDYEAGRATQYQLAAEYGTTQTTISRIVRRTTYAE